ncbi:hypothetical protein [Clostridium estertheticum]|uniref:WD40 repeat domain-containing protein n=1 Tax=Clostridium estertheticum TaxID=238834 RepID=A0A5N7J0Q1_9CLOT|nr:hypothetical protein [Clostridium estertheticum]MCB2343287.1 hypothetical protein [Clostridium estertheticum]MPQ31650.1 hypothetical protein [Clostridium estertheticum]MPQ62314.1 hypothetical protein [Clostridium estertheticum]
MNWDRYNKLSNRWLEEGKIYSEAVNKFVEKGLKEGWDNVGEDPLETRYDMADKVIKIIKQANKEGQIEELKKCFPAAYEPLTGNLQGLAQAITSVLITTDEKIIFKAGDTNEEGKLFIVDNGKTEVIENALYAGCSCDKSIYAIAYEDCIETYLGWKGKLINKYSWPDIMEGYGSEDSAKVHNGGLDIVGLIPFSDKKRLLLVTYEGIFVLDSNETIRIYPDESYMEGLDEEDVMNFYFDMVHGAISSNDEYIAIGEQDSNHIILDGKTYKEIISIDPQSSYPHCALFDKSDEYLIVNSCQGYNGITTQFSINEIHDEDKFEDSEIEIDDNCRIYAGISRNDEYILGDADGYLRAFSMDGEPRWQYYVGSTITGMDISKDEKKLLVGTCAGMLHLLDLDSEIKSEYSIGTGNVFELQRWIAWKGEKDILEW